MGLEMNLTDQRIELKSRLDSLQLQAALLVQWIQHNPDYPCIIQDAIKPEFLSAFTRLCYLGEQAAGGTDVFTGVQGLSSEAMLIAEKTNQARAQVKQQLIKMDRIKVKQQDPESGLEVEVGLGKEALSRLGLSRFNRTQVYRQSRIIYDDLHKINYFMAHVSKTRKISKEDLLNRLKTIGDNSGAARQLLIEADIKCIEGVRRGWFAWVKPPVEHIRANIVTEQGGIERRSLITTSDLVFFHWVKGQKRPRFGMLTEKKQLRKPRSKTKISAQPLLRSVPVYNYIN